MIEIEVTQGIEAGRLRLGEICMFRIHRQDPTVEVRWFIHFGNILQTRPMSDWSDQLTEIEWLPESPGMFRLEVQWRHGDSTDREELTFEAHPNIHSNRVFAARPSRVSRGRRGKFWAPNEYESKGIVQYETALFDRLPGLVKNGDVVYDVGANIGLFSVPFSKGVGAEGRVICFEPNPICVSFLRANLEVNGCANASIVPLALTAGSQQVSFTLNFGNSLLGLTDISGFFRQKAGQEISVEGRALDELRESFRLPAPKLVKMDVEGAEGAAIHGMASTLRDHRPTLLMEIHGANAAREVASVLDPLGYRYQEAAGGGQFGSSAELAASLERGPVVQQVICRV